MKRILTFLALLGFSAVSLVAVARVVRTELSAERSFDRAAMEAWLISTDADTHRFVAGGASWQVRRAARLLERDFHDDYDWRPFYDSLGKDDKPRFQGNFLSLVRLMFEQRADHYVTLPRHAREAYLDGQLRDVSHWYVLGDKGKKLRGLEVFMPAPQFANSLPADFTFDSQRSPAGEQADAEFLRDLQARFLSRVLGTFMPGKKEKPRRED